MSVRRNVKIARKIYSNKKKLQATTKKLQNRAIEFKGQ